MAFAEISGFAYHFITTGILWSLTPTFISDWAFFILIIYWPLQSVRQAYKDVKAMSGFA